MKLGKPAIAALAIGLSVPANADIGTDESLNRCIRKNAVELGKENQEDATTVVRAAFVKCKDEVAHARKMANVFYLTSRIAPGYEWAINEYALYERWKEAATNEGVAALLEARANAKPSSS